MGPDRRVKTACLRLSVNLEYPAVPARPNRNLAAVVLHSVDVFVIRHRNKQSQQSQGQYPFRATAPPHAMGLLAEFLVFKVYAGW